MKHFTSMRFETFHPFPALSKLRSGTTVRGTVWFSQVKKIFTQLALLYMYLIIVSKWEKFAKKGRNLFSLRVELKTFHNGRCG